MEKIMMTVMILTTLKKDLQHYHSLRTEAIKSCFKMLKNNLLLNTLKIFLKFFKHAFKNTFEYI